jgi:hypothetical protein
MIEVLERKANMKTATVFTRGFLFLIATVALFAASNGFAIDDPIISRSEVETVAETSDDQRSLETAAPPSSSNCITDSMVSGDQRRPDQQTASSERSRILTPVKTDECTETGYSMPMNR